MKIKIGLGKSDVTGPCARVGFMGMSNIQQRGRGIHTRLYSRTFVVEDQENGKSVAFVCADIGACTIAMKQAVIKKLKEKGPSDAQGHPIYTEKNVMITATHTHSGPGGYSHYHVYNASIGGFNKQNFDCIVEGIYKSIVEAHNKKSPGKILIAEGDLNECGKIRSVGAYVKNSEIEDILPLDDDENVEPIYNKMKLLKFVDANEKELGSFNWFALHPTNMGEKNKWISGDNKGYAEQLFEKELEKRGNKNFISSFANSCCGDISANAGKDENGNKYGRPDGKHDLEHTEKFGLKQFQKALDLYDSASEELDGNIDYCQTYVDMSDCFVEEENARTWPAAMGYGMLRGSQEDSTGLGKNFWGEGTTKYNMEGNPQWFKKLAKIVAKVINIKWPQPPDPDFEEGQGAKAIFLPLGYMIRNNVPIAPSILPLQMLKLGSLLIVAHPGELTTVAGKRLRESIEGVFEPQQSIKHVVIATYANAFSSYTTTHEEYAEQYYEGASTLFGPWTFKAYKQENIKLAEAMRDGLDVPDGPQPKDIPVNKIKELKAGMVMPDYKLRSLEFGKFDEQPKTSYRKGETVLFSFVGGYPNRDLKTGGSYFKVEKERPNGSWELKYMDDDFCTQMHWFMMERASMIRLVWKIPDTQESGTYRIVYDGPVKKKSGGKVEPLPVEVKFTIK